MAWMPGASRVQTFSGNRHKARISKIVLHTTEGSSWPGYGGGGSAPHFTVHRDGTIRQHIDTAYSAKALVNRSGGVETNNGGVVQIEFIGSCDRAYARKHGLFFTEDATDKDLAGLAKVLAWIHDTHGVPLTASGLRWPTTNAAYATAPQRLSYSAWNRYEGVLGHTHVPENDHWDPGAFPVARLLLLATGNRTPAASVEFADVDDTQRWLNALGYGPLVVDGVYGARTKAATLAAQKDLDISPADGRPGPATRTHLEAAVTTLDKISKDLAEVKRTLEPGIAGQRHDGEAIQTLRGFRNLVRRDIAALSGELDGVLAAVRAVEAGEPIDLDKVRAASREGVAAALKDLEADVSLTLGTED